MGRWHSFVLRAHETCHTRVLNTDACKIFVIHKQSATALERRRSLCLALAEFTKPMLNLTSRVNCALLPSLLAKSKTYTSIGAPSTTFNRSFEACWVSPHGVIVFRWLFCCTLMQRIFRPICQRVSYQACRNYTATGGGGGKGGRTFVSEQEVQEAIQQLDWETMAREAEWDWSRNWYEDEGFGEGWLPNEWDDDWMQELQEMGKVPGGVAYLCSRVHVHAHGTLCLCARSKRERERERERLKKMKDPKK